MKKLPVIAVILAAIFPASCATTQGPTVVEASIPFANRNGIQDFEPVGEDVVYLRVGTRKWYRATLFSPCIGLDQKIGIAYETNPDGSFDRTSALRVNGQRCQVQSLVESGPPPSRENRRGR